MRRWIPEVGALCERVRRPAITLLIALAMALPGASMLIRGEPGPGTTSPRLAAESASASARASASERAVAHAWRSKALDRQQAAVAERFAAEFGINESLARQIHDAAVEEDIEPRVAFGLVQTESSFRRRAVSHVGAVGYTQLLPSTARWIAPGTSRPELFNTQTNLRVGFRYLRHLMDKYDGDVRLALTAYNRGPGTVDRVLKRGRNPENGYADKVLGTRVRRG